eukprot:GHVU01113090.1.p1 GENE.GHVU01113090.1~~GHVU01113090.1.p1  ORF type:complete len:174 (+),score=26.31 GHVU01113090.1:71-523(+)
MKNHVFDLSFHPSMPIAAACDVAGYVHFISADIAQRECFVAGKARPSKKSCRNARFLNDNSLAVASSDCCCYVLDGNREVVFKGNHDDSVNSLERVDEHCFYAGDDGGCISLWDTRVGGGPTRESSDEEDYIACMKLSKDGRRLWASRCY